MNNLKEALLDRLMKAEKLAIGTVKTYSGKKYKKTKNGWMFVPSGRKSKAKSKTKTYKPSAKVKQEAKMFQNEYKANKILSDRKKKAATKSKKTRKR